MKSFFRKILFLLGALLSLSIMSYTYTMSKQRYKCMIQMVNYTGEGAYIAVSLLDSEGDYVETLYVHGDDKEWYHDIKQWWQFYGKRRPNIDAITGATITGGQRTITVLQIEEDKIDTGYRLRFETAVEDQGYYTDDVEFELSTDLLQNKIEGKGFIRYIRMIPQ